MPIKNISLTNHHKKHIYNQKISGKSKEDLHFKLALSLNDFHLSSGLIANRFMQAAQLSQSDYLPIIIPGHGDDTTHELVMPDELSIENLKELNQELNVIGIELSSKFPDSTYDVIYHQAFNALVFESIEKTALNHLEQVERGTEVNLLLPSYPYVVTQAGDSEFIVPNSIKAAASMISNSISIPFEFKEVERNVESSVNPGPEQGLEMGR